MGKLASTVVYKDYVVSVASTATGGRRVYLSYCGDTVLLTTVGVSELLGERVAALIASQLCAQLLAAPEAHLCQVFKDKKKAALKSH